MAYIYFLYFVVQLLIIGRYKYKNNNFVLHFNYYNSL